MVWRCVIYVLCALCVQQCKSQSESRPKFWLESSSLPGDLRLVPAVGNGHVATQVYHDTIYMNNLYTGNRSESHRARIPSTVAVKVTAAGRRVTHRLDMYQGLFLTRQEDASVFVEQRTWADREAPELLLTAVCLGTRPGQPRRDVTAELTLNRGNVSDDLVYNDTDDGANPYIYTAGHIKQEEYPGTGFVQFHQYWSRVPARVTHRANETADNVTCHVFVTSISTNQRSALRAFNNATATSYSDLLSRHTQSWAALWDSFGLDLDGDLDLSTTLNAALFHTLISVPLRENMDNRFAGLSPGGLARGGWINKTRHGGPYNDYAGHVFWDMDTWIMPNLLVYRPDLAKLTIHSRERVHENVRDYARQWGLRGVRYPWEQAYSGFEVCPWRAAVLYQIHVTADVAYSVRQYIQATKDASMVAMGTGWARKMVFDTARFWQSRTVLRNSSKGYEIERVMGPDEYNYNINNSVFTNYNAKLALSFPLKLTQIFDNATLEYSEEELGEARRMHTMAVRMYLPFDAGNQYHPQYDRFNPHNTTIKQSDVVLLGYPLMKNMSRAVRRNDLEIYEQITDRFGPDTGTWSMHTVGWLELGNVTKAAEMFRVMLRNINGPFKIFSEKPASAGDGMRATNFITGAGGLLQAVHYGYAGLRYRPHRLDLTPHLLPGAATWRVRHVTYKRWRLALEVAAGGAVVTPSGEREPGHEDMFVIRGGTGDRTQIQPGVNISVALGETVHFSVRSELDLTEL